MYYEIIKGQPSAGRCEIGAYIDNELMATYTGFYDFKKGAWKLYPLRRYALPMGQKMNALTLTERDVHVRKRTTAAKPEEKKKPEEETKAKPKPWWTLPDPEGQIKMF